MDKTNAFTLKYLIENGIHQPRFGSIFKNSCMVINDLEGNQMVSVPKFFSQPTRMNAVIFAVCQRGEGAFSCDVEEYILKPGDLFIYRPNAIIQTKLLTGIKFSCVIIDAPFLEQLNLSMQKLLPYAAESTRGALFHLEDDTRDELLQLIHMMNAAINKDKDSMFYDEKVKSHIQLFIYTLLSGLTMQLQLQEKENKVHTREEEYIRNFFRYLADYHQQERSVNFYADKVHLTPKYLSTMLKHATGRTASDWIDGYVILEAKNLLKNSGQTVQQVAYALNFPTQSFFGKYFKHRTGMSPGEYQSL